MEKELINYLRITSCLEIEKACSGHPGVCLSMAPMAYEVYKHAFFNADKPNFITRDRIVFSAGHSSALIYACLHLFGFDVTKKDLQNFRQLNSRTSGHPEKGLTAGVDASTGPLGQGVGMAVGMAIAENFLRKKYEKGSLKPISHFTFCFVGDGDLMEGVALEAISLAGHMGLNKLILLYDKNDITIEGSTSIASSSQVENRFLAENWNVINVSNGNDEKEIEEAILSAKKSERPSIIITKTKIGFGSELEGSATVHGKPLNKEQILKLRERLNYFSPDFELSQTAKKYLEKIQTEKEKEFSDYLKMLDKYKFKFPQEFNEIDNLEDFFDFDFASLLPKVRKMEFNGRNEGNSLINLLFEKMPNLLSGTADLSPSTRTNFEKSGFFNEANATNRNLAFGIREHAMGAVCNGISLHGGLRVLCSTFLAFENYMAPAIRLSAFMENPVLYYFTHDSISVGEDGPTHQPVEQIATLRAMPNLNVFRPCGVEELLAGFETFFKDNLPMAMLLPRQVTNACHDNFDESFHGAYEISNIKNYDITIVSTGSEVYLALSCAELLKKKNIFARVVSMPCVELFEKESKEYQSKIIDKTKPVFCVECGGDNIWYKFATSNEFVIKMHSFGKSGKMEDVLDFFGFTPQKLATRIENLLKK